MTDTVAAPDTWVEDVRRARTVHDLHRLFLDYGGAANGPEFVQVFSWRREEMQRQGGGTVQSTWQAEAEGIFQFWEKAITDMQEHGKAWAQADAQVKRYRAKKFLYFRHQGKSVTDAEAHADDDEEVFQARLTRNTNEAMLKADYSVRDRLQARWEYVRSQMSTERAADSLSSPNGGHA
jgi:hypothetical protein